MTLELGSPEFDAIARKDLDQLVEWGVLVSWRRYGGVWEVRLSNEDRPLRLEDRAVAILVVAAQAGVESGWERAKDAIREVAGQPRHRRFLLRRSA